MRPLSLLLLSLVVLTACVDIDTYSDDNAGNFEALWTIMDEHYCFFDYKAATIGVDWDEVHARYRPQVEGATRTQLFEVLVNMLSELQDGHVNLATGWDYGRYWSWKEDYPTNFSDTLYRRYMGTDYRLSAGLEYRILDDNIGYLRIASFETGLGEGNIDNALLYLLPCRSLILDIRSNGGGALTLAQRVAQHFLSTETLVGYMQHKTGTGHSDFSALAAEYLSPSDGIRWQKAVFLLTNRGVYSAANEFVMYMRSCEQCTIIGDTTGGGAGLPFTNELPNGWTVRYSSCPMYDVNKECIEHGIAPDIPCSLTAEDVAAGYDTLIELARQLTD